MPIPAIRSIQSPDLERGSLPEDGTDCAVLIEAEIGPPDRPGGDLFSFVAITPLCLARQVDPQWGRGMLLLPEFSWSSVEQALQKLVMHADRQTWEESAGILAKELHWEFDN